ncbi:MAG: GNAT family N-acetyltransferase [Oscillospiraceae bacterium]|nr:GNAT family N-acetyltransferase [Oscillospiraceae bacterium]MCL2279514.1 GNAT family N-acetyltransferase [Oscillospiraceae bacterium]
MDVRKLLIRDIPQLMMLYERIMPDFLANKLELSEKVYQEIINNDDYLILVAVSKSELIGTAMGICCKTLAFEGKNFMVVEDVSVLPGFQGQGIGRRLFAALDTFAHDRNCGYSVIVSSAFRAEAHTFYEKMGYTDSVKGFRKIYNYRED